MLAGKNVGGKFPKKYGKFPTTYRKFPIIGEKLADNFPPTYFPHDEN